MANDSEIYVYIFVQNGYTQKKKRAKKTNTHSAKYPMKRLC